MYIYIFYKLSKSDLNSIKMFSNESTQNPTLARYVILASDILIHSELEIH